jgi:hypothetical protein
MQKKLNFAPTILITITFFKYKLHLQSRDVKAIVSAFNKLSSFIDTASPNLENKLSQELLTYDQWEKEYLERKNMGIININREEYKK